MKMLSCYPFSRFFFCFLTLLWSHIVFSADYQSARIDGLGGAGHANPVFGDSIYLNPSFVSFQQTHSLNVGYTLYNEDNSSSGHLLNLSVTDGSADNLFQAGIGYTRRQDASFLHVVASKSFFKNYGTGLGTKVIFPYGGLGTNGTLVDGTLSVIGTLTPWFTSTFIVDNLFERATSLGLYREYIIGTKFNVQNVFMVYFDPNWVPSLPAGQPTWGYQLGGEFPIFTDLFLRLGVFRNSMVPTEGIRGDGYSAGLGWMAPKISLNYAFTRVTGPSPANSHNMGVNVYF